MELNSIADESLIHCRGQINILAKLSKSIVECDLLDGSLHFRSGGTPCGSAVNRLGRENQQLFEIPNAIVDMDFRLCQFRRLGRIYQGMFPLRESQVVCKWPPTQRENSHRVA